MKGYYNSNSKKTTNVEISSKIYIREQWFCGPQWDSHKGYPCNFVITDTEEKLVFLQFHHFNYPESTISTQITVIPLCTSIKLSLSLDAKSTVHISVVQSTNWHNFSKKKNFTSKRILGSFQFPIFSLKLFLQSFKILCHEILPCQLSLMRSN